MRAWLMRLFGWRVFRIGDVRLFQRDVLVDQTCIAKALQETSGLRRWCKDKDLTIMIEDRDFPGLYGRLVRSEVIRFTSGVFRARSATIRIASSLVDYPRLVDLIREVGHVPKNRD